MKSLKLGSILTAASTPEDMAKVVEFTKSAASVFVLTNLPVPSAFGLFPVRLRKSCPSLWEALVNHIGRIRGKETVGVVLPGINLPTDFSVMQHSLGSNRMELSWAFRANASYGVLRPDLIVLTTSLLPHIVQNLKDDVPFEKDAWAVWLHDWCLKTMPSHKYIDITSGLGLPELQPIPVTEAVLDDSTAIYEAAGDNPPIGNKKPVKVKSKAKKKK